MTRCRVLCLLMIVVLLVLFFMVSEEETLETTTDESTLEGIPRGDAARRKILQLLAIRGLTKLKEDHAFEILDIQDMSGIATRGLVRKWEPCVLAKVNNRLHAVLLGGSSSARPAQHCFVTPAKDPSEGRFSDILEYKLNEQGWKATITNMAQGSTTSTWSGIMMDQLVSPRDSTLDLLIWEHAINDHAPSSSGSPDQMLRFWLTRIQNLWVVRNKKTPPPILIVYLWKFNIGLQDPFKIGEHGMGYLGPDFQKSLQVIDHFIQQGMDIAVLNLAEIIRPEVFAGFVGELLDDRHHPGCRGSHLVANLLQYVLYEQLVVNGDAANCEEQPAKAITVEEDPTNMMMDPTTTIGAFSQWEPTLPHSQPSLKMEPVSIEQAAMHRKNIFPEADMPGRHDTKFGYRIPLCTEPKPLQLVLLDAAKWQGLMIVFAGRGIQFTINGDHTLVLQGQGAKVSSFPSPVNIPRGAHDWIDISKFGNVLQLAFCDSSTLEQRTNSRGKEQHGWIHLLVGVAAAAG